jgi:hypothetical protein
MVDSSAPHADVEAVARVATEYFQSPFVEHLPLARFGDRWLIVNALYCLLV